MQATNIQPIIIGTARGKVLSGVLLSAKNKIAVIIANNAIAAHMIFE